MGCFAGVAMGVGFKNVEKGRVCLLVKTDDKADSEFSLRGLAMTGRYTSSYAAWKGGFL